MRNYPLVQADAFTKTPLTGNACAIVFDADDLTDEQLVAIARETNQAETSFVMHSEIADFKVRYFTPSEEIPLAGHPTLATTQALIDMQRITLQSDRHVITLELKVGVIEVEVTQQEDSSPLIKMHQPKPEFFHTYAPSDVTDVFNIAPHMLIEGAPIQTVSTGTRQLMIPVNSIEHLRTVQLDFPKYHQLKSKGDFFSPHIFCIEGATTVGDTFARHFGVPPDLYEDPFTGSATGGMAAYLWRYNLIDQPHFIAEQGHWMQRPGQAQVEVIGSRHDIESVSVGGHAVVVFRGVLTL